MWFPHIVIDFVFVLAMHAGLEASRWQPPLDSPCDGPVTYPGDTKILVKSSKGRSGPTLNNITLARKNVTP